MLPSVFRGLGPALLGALLVGACDAPPPRPGDAPGDPDLAWTADGASPSGDGAALDLERGADGPRPDSGDAAPGIDGPGREGGAGADGGLCDRTSCPQGCCQGGRCLDPQPSSCGSGGQLCQSCDPIRADSCIDGACACGRGAPCADGQHCLGGQCGCDEISCPAGCCAAATCRPPSLGACGDRGRSCLACDGALATACVAGACRCGNGPGCEAGQRCQGGACVCDGATCPAGCCDGGRCRAPTVASCGQPGAACVACPPLLADRCLAGACACGNGAPCAAGQRCLGGQCVCDPVSCPLGCCKGIACLAPSPTSCGTAGAACVTCAQGNSCDRGVCSGCAANCKGCCSGEACNQAPSHQNCGANGSICLVCDPLRSDACTVGACTCGGGPACASGQACVGGKCVCDGNSCPDGCCEGATCRRRILDACGFLGGGCMTCDPTLADACDRGDCRCGAGPSCDAGQRCLAGRCVCDGKSCGGGCCAGDTCNPASLSACGSGGGACAICDPRRTDRCVDGQCRCGMGASCAVGQACVGGLCVCNAQSCPTGCCRNQACQAGNDAAACGSGGAACVACADGEGCAGGSCAGCAKSCPGGCCSGATCNPPKLATCGLGGAACVACDPGLADGCVNGACACGGGKPCLPGQACAGGACTCSPQSCQNGCCFGSTCFVGVNCATCKAYHQGCTKNTDCCSNSCVAGTCDVPALACKLAGGLCGGDGECCSRRCDLNLDGGKRCSGPNQCRPVGAPCAAANECCSLYCDPQTRLCAGGKVCQLAGGPCGNAVECCSNVCSAGRCAAVGPCASLGESCNGNGGCCSQVCVGGRCFFANYCRAGGDICAAHADCCNGACDAKTKRCAVLTQCVPTNEPCSGLRSCCNTLCVDTRLGQFCFPIGGCRPTSEVCTDDKQCCSLKCGPADGQGVRRCARVGNCIPDGDVCGGLGASQNCCTGGKQGCHKTANGVSRCFPNFGGMCLGDGKPCQFADQCCGRTCLPDANSPSGFSCGSKCVPIGMGTCTQDADCCTGGVCQAGICRDGGQKCSPLGGKCAVGADCCAGLCVNGSCQVGEGF